MNKEETKHIEEIALENNTKSVTNAALEKVSQNTSIDLYEQSLRRVSRIEELVERLKDSSYAQKFYDKEYHKLEDGSIDKTKQPIITFNKSDMVVCLGIAAEYNIPPFTALAYGRELNLTSIKKLEKGKKLGLDAVTSLDLIYIWEAKGREVIYTSIHVVTAKLAEAGIKIEVLKDGTIETSKWINYYTGEIVEFDPSKHKDFTSALKLDTAQKEIVLAKIKEKDSIPVYSTPPVKEALVRLTRPSKYHNVEDTVIAIPYTNRQAIDAGLLEGVNSKGETVAGKSNWNNHEATHLVKMSTILGARMIASDLLYGLYIPEELPTITKLSNTDKFDYADSEVIE